MGKAIILSKICLIFITRRPLRSAKIYKTFGLIWIFRFAKDDAQGRLRNAGIERSKSVTVGAKGAKGAGI